MEAGLDRLPEHLKGKDFNCTCPFGKHGFYMILRETPRISSRRGRAQRVGDRVAHVALALREPLEVLEREGGDPRSPFRL
jgi:hypothetical protein